MKKLSALERGWLALKTMKSKGVKVTKHSVAISGNFNHANFYKRQEEWIRLREEVEKAERDQLSRAKEIKDSELRQEVIYLKQQLEQLKLDKKQLQSKISSSKQDKLLVHITELYRLNDKLQTENHALKTELKQRASENGEVVNINKGTREIIKDKF